MEIKDKKVTNEKRSLSFDDAVLQGEEVSLDDIRSVDIPKELMNINEEQIDKVLNPTIKRTRGKKSTVVPTEDLVRDYIKTKNEKIWCTLQERFWFGIKKYAYQIVNSWDDAEDLTIETFMKALTAIDKFDPDKAKFSTWIWTICRNNCLLFLKYERRILKVDSDISDIYDSTMINSSKGNMAPTEHLVIEDDGDILTLSNEDVIQRMYDTSVAEIKNIGGTTGAILEMKLVDNKKIREIASVLNMNESTVKNYLYKGKEDLSKIMRKQHKELYEMYLESNAERAEYEMQFQLLAEILL